MYSYISEVTWEFYQHYRTRRCLQFLGIHFLPQLQTLEKVMLCQTVKWIIMFPRIQISSEAVDQTLKEGQKWRFNWLYVWQRKMMLGRICKCKYIIVLKWWLELNSGWLVYVWIILNYANLYNFLIKQRDA